MSHLACSDEPEHAKNEVQKAFDALRAKLPSGGKPRHSAGILLGPPSLRLVRPGIALYGGKASTPPPTDLPPWSAFGRSARRDVPPGETVGFGATRTLKRPARRHPRVGYADGVFRALSVADAGGFAGSFGPHPAPLIGRVSMDLITVDVTDVPASLPWRGAWVELIGTHVAAHECRHTPAPSTTKSHQSRRARRAIPAASIVMAKVSKAFVCQPVAR
jgi:alanine racemase